MTTKTTWVVGAGSVGAITAARLRGDPPSRVIDGWAPNVEAIRSNGLVVEYSDALLSLSLPANHLHEVAELDERPDIVLLAVKSIATHAVVTELLPNLRDTTVVVSLQNGINEVTIADLVGAERTIGAVVAYGGEMLAPGRIRTPRRFSGAGGQLVLGELDGTLTPRLKSLAEDLRLSVPVETTDNIWGWLWSKLIVNVQINALCALLGKTSEAVASSEVLRRLALSMAIEGIEVATKIGIQLDASLIWGKRGIPLQILDTVSRRRAEASFIDRWKSGAKPSMLQDVEAGRPTEIDAINGHVVSAGELVGVRTPLNTAIIELIKELETDGPRQRGASTHDGLKTISELVGW